MTSTIAIYPAERRQHEQLREVFEGAYEQLEPFLDPANSWNGQTLELLAFRIMRENYPQVSGNDINLFISAAKRVYAERRKTTASPSIVRPAERRQNTKLRDIFEGAYELIEPFLDPANSWSGQTLEHLAFRVMRENYPQVSSDDIYVLLSAAKRVFAERRQKPRTP